LLTNDLSVFVKDSKNKTIDKFCVENVTF